MAGDEGGRADKPTFGILLQSADGSQEVLSGGRSRREALTIAKLAVINRSGATGAFIYPVRDSHGDSYLLRADGHVTNVSETLRREA